MERLIAPITVWTGRKILERGAILIRDGTVAAIGSAGELSAATAAERIDGSGKLAIPGLINAHTHLYSSLARGMSVSPFAPTSFTEILEQLWWKLDKALEPESLRASALIGAMEAARCGVSTLIDHHASPSAIGGSLGKIGDAVERAGLRASLSYEVTDRNGSAGARAGIEENAAWLERCRDADGRRHGLVGVHASFTVGDDTLRACVELARKHDTGLHVHVAESSADQEDSLAK